MTNAKFFLLPVAALVSILGCATFAHATVYSWRDEHGKLHFCNAEDEVPEAHRPVAKTFTSKLAAQNPVAGPPVTAPAPSVAPDTISAYERGLERGLQTAERQVALAGELARTLLVAAQPPPPAPPLHWQGERTKGDFLRGRQRRCLCFRACSVNRAEGGQ